MIRALYTAASAMLFGIREQDIAADNLANTRTSGFKAETSAAEAFQGVLARSVNAGNSPVSGGGLDDVLGRVGTGVWQAVKGNDFTDGALRDTDDPLDLAVSGEGFFAVQTPNGTEYTRDGHFKRDLNNTLISQSGLPVLDENGQSITLDTDHVRIKPTGDILIGDNVVAKLGVYNIDPATSLRAGGNRFQAGPGTQATQVILGTNTTVQQGKLEEANVNAAKAASQVLSVSRQFDASQHVFSTINDTLEAAVIQIGKVA